MKTVYLTEQFLVSTQENLSYKSNYNWMIACASQHCDTLQYYVQNLIWKKLNFTSLKTNWWDKSFVGDEVKSVCQHWCILCKTTSMCVRNDDNKFNNVPDLMHQILTSVLMLLKWNYIIIHKHTEQEVFKKYL